ncbi:hypothetical protein CPAR01_02455 [Colletotrichum paranaense]|uniref:Uncharacterized protein n=1 Tax=Colletotrichum paranaense TaxID=1914294 RepID=A0ABQ9SZK6_9PEZI|nr:uncharacterized protein CPAR01_02455 [Colletotrichum paranaense]KAK1544953.1 hypothetical protein CPAR01_02455 [Colletotrichum paranaense]
MMFVVGYGSAGGGSVSHSLGDSPQRRPRTENIADSKPRYVHRQQAAHSHLRPGSSSDEPPLCMLASQHVFLRAATPVGCLSLTCSSRLHLIGGLRHSHHTMPTLDGRQLLRFYSLLESETSRAQHTRSSGGDREQPDKVPFLKYPSTLVFLHGAIVAYQRLGLHFTHFLLGEYHPSFLLLWASPLSRVLTL